MDKNILIGPDDTSGIPHLPIGKLILDALKGHEKTSLAMIDIKSGESYTYGDLINFSQNLASSLRNLNINKIVIIAIVSENSHKFCVALLAGLYLAAPVHLISPGYTEYELKQVLTLSKPKLLFCSKKSLSSLMNIRNEFDFIQNIIIFDDHDGDGSKLYKNLIKDSGGSFHIEEDVDITTQTAIICNTSGTTGPPKGAMITHENLRFHFVHGRKVVFTLKPAEFIQIVVPFVHIYGLYILNAVLYSGATLLWMDDFHPTLFLETIQNYRLEQLFLVPSLINFLASSSLTEEYDLSSIRIICTAGAPILDEDCASLKRKFKLETLYNLYGSTETTGLALFTPKNIFCSNGCVGKLAPGYQLKVVDIESREKLAACKSGELCFKSPTLMKGYINDVKTTEENFDSEGFLLSGDLGYYDKDGFVYLVGRIKDIIIYKANQVSPHEIENILLTHPSVAQVVVVGKPDKRAGEVAVGFIVKEEGAIVSEKEISEYLSKFVCVEKRLHGGIRFVNDLPKNKMGKVLRNELRQMLKE